jgi:hypothetical protein
VQAARLPAEAAQRAPPEAVGVAAQAALLAVAAAEARPGLPAAGVVGASPARLAEAARHA